MSSSVRCTIGLITVGIYSICREHLCCHCIWVDTISFEKVLTLPKVIKMLNEMKSRRDLVWTLKSLKECTEHRSSKWELEQKQNSGVTYLTGTKQYIKILHKNLWLLTMNITGCKGALWI